MLPDQYVCVCACVLLTHDGLVGVGVAHRVGSRNNTCAGKLRCPSILDLYVATQKQGSDYRETFFGFYIAATLCVCVTFLPPGEQVSGGGVLVMFKGLEPQLEGEEPRILTQRQEQHVHDHVGGQLGLQSAPKRLRSKVSPTVKLG